MKKSFLIAAAAISAVLLFSGCEADPNNLPPTVSSEVSSEEASSADTVSMKDSYENSFDGFVEYMTDSGFVGGEATDTSADAIGAVSGKRYIASGSSKISVELYEFPTDNLSEIAKTTIENAKKDGSFDLYGYTSATQYTTAAVTDDGRFMMLYTDASTNEDSIAMRDEAVKTVQNFGK